MYTYEYIYIYIYVSIYIDILYEYMMVSGTVSTPVRSHMHTLILLQTNVILKINVLCINNKKKGRDEINFI